MKSRPILFTAENAQLVHYGKKTQTRRIIKPQGAILTDALARGLGVQPPMAENTPVIPCPFGTVGDQLWAREPWRLWEGGDEPDIITASLRGYCPDPEFLELDKKRVEYRGNSHCDDEGPWRPSIHMPRWASRTTLEITEIRAQRLQDISEEDSIAEGIQRISYDGLSGWNDYVTGFPLDCPRASYRTLWESINGPGSWEKNVWVWVLTFKRIGL